MHDLLIDLRHLTESLHKGDYKEALLELLCTINDTLYVTLFLGAGSEVVVASLCAQFLMGIHRSRAHLQKGKKLEGVSHLLMSLIRGHQAIRQYQAICIQKEIYKAQKEGKPYLPLANRTQIFFVNAGYRINGLARWTIRQIGDSFRPTQSTFSRFQTAAKVTALAPLVLVSSLFSTPCYLAASYAGIGRFERMEANSSSPHSVSNDQLRVMFQNICGQDPWSIFTGGQTPPLEAGSEGKRRIDAIVETLLKERPDIYYGQEYDDLDTSRIVGENLARQGYFCVRDLGCNDPFFNHSGLFVAVRSRDVANSIAFLPIAPEHTSGITYWCNRGLLTANVPMQDGSQIKVINFHLNSGSSPQDQEMRLNQIQKYIFNHVQSQPALAVGDSNLDTASLSEEQKTSAGLLSLKNALEGRVTCSDEGKHVVYGKPLEGCPDCQEKIDAAFYDPNRIRVEKVKIMPGNSDHSAICVNVNRGP